MQSQILYLSWQGMNIFHFWHYLRSHSAPTQVEHSVLSLDWCRFHCASFVHYLKDGVSSLNVNRRYICLGMSSRQVDGPDQSKFILHEFFSLGILIQVGKEQIEDYGKRAGKVVEVEQLLKYVV
ncbi:unnamed protein product, partial [Choristocarpus tenellus]